MTANYNTGLSVNLIDIGKFLKIDDSILGIKYNYGETSILKGKYSTSIYNKSKNKKTDKINTKLFYNQISLIIALQNTNVNVKLFGNGMLHITGLKDYSYIEIIGKIIKNALRDIEGLSEKILLTTDENNILLNNDNIIFSYSEPKKIIGYKELKTGKYNINNKFYLIDSCFSHLFISEKFTEKRTRELLDLDGNTVGTCNIELLKNKLKLYKKNSNIYFDKSLSIIDNSPPFSLIYHDKNIIGKVIYNFSTIVKKETDCAFLEYNYSCNPINKDIMRQSVMVNADVNINCINIYFNIQYELNRQRLFNKLNENGYICEYKPEKYSGIKLLYKIPINCIPNSRHGICYCNNKCTCNTITFLIFQSGNIISVGYRNQNDINNIVSNFKEILDKYESIIKKKIF
jgi:TATA-box binding protein (TBP) (component of TFIID and TFIIIB)